MSQSLKVVSSAASSCALLRRRAMVWRSRVILTRSSRRSPAGAGAVAGAGAACETAGAGAAFLACAAASTSSLVRRPSLPVPLICVGSTPCSSTARRTAGESVVVWSSSSAGAGVGAGAGGFSAAGWACSRSLTSVVSPAACVSSIVAITAPTSTVSPAWTRYSPITPATGAGTSTATLSVSRLAIGSSSLTGSPGFLSHSPIVASVTDSPSVGTFTSTGMVADPVIYLRHPELVSGPIHHPAPSKPRKRYAAKPRGEAGASSPSSARAEKWVPKQVRDDGNGRGEHHAFNPNASAT